MASPSFFGIHGGIIILSAGLPSRYLVSTHTPRRADTHTCLAIDRCDSSDAISSAELPIPTTTTFLPRMSIGSNTLR